MREFTEQETNRRNKLDKIKEYGIDPFGQKFERDAYSVDVKEKYKEKVS